MVGRRVVVKRSAGKGRTLLSAAEEHNLETLADEYVTLIAKNAANNARMDKIAAEVKDLMDSGRKKEFLTKKAVCSITVSKGRASKTIDPAKFRAEMKNDSDFFSCISVSKTKAEEFLPKKTITAITDTVYGKDGDPKLSIRPRVEKDGK